MQFRSADHGRRAIRPGDGPRRRRWMWLLAAAGCAALFAVALASEIPGTGAVLVGCGAALMVGTSTFETEPGVETTFIVCLPDGSPVPGLEEAA